MPIRSGHPGLARAVASRGFLLSALGFTFSCAAPATPVDAPTPPVASATPSTPPAAAPPASAPPPPASSPGEALRRPPPTNAAECKAMLGTERAARSDARVVPGPGAGQSERFAGIVATIRRERGAFRCCYELWAKNHPRRDAKVVLSFLLDVQGAASEVHLKRAAGDALTDEAEACFVDVAMAMTYPRSPSEKETSFEYELGFKHHKALEP